MTGVEAILLLIGSIFMIGSFFITEKLSPSELNKIAELSENELKKIIDRSMVNAEKRIDETIEEHIEASEDQVDRILEKETNEKIMAISEYSDTVVESMNKTHNEIMFLYSMLNDKHTELTGMISNLQHMAADVRSLEENLQQMTEDVAHTVVQSVPETLPQREDRPLRPATALQKEGPTPKAAAAPKTVKTNEKKEPVKPQESLPKVSVQVEGKPNANEQILALHREGLSEVEIAKRLGMGVGEIRLIIGLYRGEDS